MTTKQKAKEIYDEAYRLLYLEGNTPLVNNLSMNVARATINRFINYFEAEWVGNYGKSEVVLYWEEVLYELENLE